LTNFGLLFLGFGFFGGWYLARFLRMRRASREKSRLVRLTVRQTLASRAFDGKVRTFPVADTERNAVL
jgi:hypothetical protein